MIGALQGVGYKKLLANVKPNFVWDAFRAGRSIGSGKEGSGRINLTIVDNNSRTPGKWLRWSDNRLEYMSAASDDSSGVETVFGPCGEFYAGTFISYTYNWTTSKFGLGAISPTSSDALVETSGSFPSILKNPDVAFHNYLTHIDTSIDAVNDAVFERSTSRSATFNRDLTFFVRSTVGTDPTGNIELGWNASSGTRTTEAPWVRKLPNSDWYVVSILVPAGGTTGHSSIKAKANTGIWEIACPVFYASFAQYERIPRFGLSHSADSARGKWDVHTTSAELCLRSEGWAAMSIVLPDRGVDAGHTDYAGASNYKFLGMLNLDCGLERLRVSMSDTYDYITVSLGDTSGTNFAFLDTTVKDWDDFAPIGLVVSWEISNGSRYATLYINGQKMDSVANPVGGWFSDNLTPGTLYIGISGADGTPAESMISRVAYGSGHMHRSYARVLSLHMRDLAMARGGSSLSAWSL